MNLFLKFTLRANANAVQICSRQICRCVAAFLQLELFGYTRMPVLKILKTRCVKYMAFNAARRWLN
jgi:hypothetical protein